MLRVVRIILTTSDNLDYLLSFEFKQITLLTSYSASIFLNRKVFFYDSVLEPKSVLSSKQLEIKYTGFQCTKN